MKKVSGKAHRRGRKKSFTLKAVKDLTLGDIEEASAIGDVAVTAGGKLGRRFTRAATWFRFCRTDPILGDEAESEYRKALDEIAEVMIQGRADVLREIADYLDAFESMRRWGRGALANEALGLVVYFVNFCTARGVMARIRESWTPELIMERFHSPTLVQAWYRKPFDPSVSEVHSFVCEVMKAPPERRSTARYLRMVRDARTLGG